LTFIHENDTDYDKLPEQVKETFTEKEVETLKELQKSFIASADYVNDILRNNDIEGNLGYIVRDWLGDNGGRGFRNDALLYQLNILSEAQERLEKKQEEITS